MGNVFLFESNRKRYFEFKKFPKKGEIMKFIYETPVDMFDDLEKKELIRITSKGCSGCDETECAVPHVFIPNRDKLNEYIDSQIEKSEVPIEKEGLEIIRDMDENIIQLKYAAVKYGETLKSEDPEAFLELVRLGSIMRGLKKLMDDIHEGDDPFNIDDLLNDQ